MLRVELQIEEHWKTLGLLKPGDPPASMTSVKDGKRDIYTFQCRGDRSEICRSRGGVDVDEPAGRRIFPLRGEDILVTLTAGQSTEMTFAPENLNGRTVQVRFTHESI